ncbi:MAG: DUF4982 domain-containing protein [Clostridia bacterium]|nr:DUF4982 domain-containing protein [Clostridia bacterium]
MREKQLMNTDWRFYFGEPEYLRTRAESSDQTYRGSRAANARGPARRDFDDRSWEIVSLPHDFVAMNGVSETDAHGGEHYDFPMDRGSAWYRRYFRLDEADKNRRVVLHFEGMGTFCEVYVNSMLMKTNRTNGIGFDVDITDVARFGFEQNVVAVHCDCHDYEAWYYEGGGITRNVWLVKTDRLAVDLWGTFVKTKRQEGGRWTAEIETELLNVDVAERRGRVVSVIQDAAGAELTRVVSEDVAVSPRGKAVVRQRVSVAGVHPWSPKSPALYTLVTLVEADGAVVDDEKTTFGFRELVFDKDHGLFVNGEKTTIYGFANHMLYLGVGEALTDAMCEYQIRTLRDMGSNGYRTAHSPHPEAIMDWCDRYGQLVMDENRIFHASDIGIDEMTRLVRRDRNHPSVCMWSVYNEEDFVTEETGRRIFRTLKQEIRKLDPTRPVTGATSYGMFSEGAHEDYDLFGFNHQTMHFDALHYMKPDKPIFCSEMIFPVGRTRNMGKLSVRPGEDALQLQKDYVVGGFHFTAWAYGPQRPRIIGMEGTLGTGYYGFKAYLKPDEPLMKICPGWDFPGQEGQPVPLSLANNGDCVELFVNDRFACRVETDMYQITPCEVPYEPGELRAVAYKDGKVWAEDSAHTPGAPARVKLVCENRRLAADGTDTAIVSAYVTDARGTVCGHETGRLARFSCDENGALLTTLSLRDDLFQKQCGPEIRFFDGKCQAIFRSLATEGDLTVTVEAEGLPVETIAIPREAAAHAQVPASPCAYVNGWRISKAYMGGMNDEALIRQHMVERWLPVDTVGTPVVERRKAGFGPAPAPVPGESLNYAYYTKAVVPDMGEKGRRRLALRFEGIDGKANIYVTDGRKTDMGRHAGDSPWFGHYRPELIVACDSFKPGDEVEIWVMMHDVGRVHGIGWPVHWLYTTGEEIAALEEKTNREWRYCEYTPEGG